MQRVGMTVGFLMRRQQHLEMFSRMANPDYATLLAQIAAEDDPVLKQQLIDQAYIFEEILTEEEISLFDYIVSGYIENNPGTVGNSFSSYVGVYYNDNGEDTGGLP
jgi:hypothetical protein